MRRARVRLVGIATVQDGGRRGLTDVGVPASGAWHRQRYLTAVALVHGRFDDRMPAVEVLGGAFEVEFLRHDVVAVTGPARVRLDGRSAAANAALAVHAGGILHVRPDGAGPCYMVIGGHDPARVLGSAATDTFSGLGPAPLRVGDHLDGDLVVDPRRVGAFLRGPEEARGPLRLVPAAGADRVALTGWRVASVARSGVRMTGPAVNARADVPSMPVLPGAVQLTPAGEAVILGPDGGLTGGYPVIGVIASVDLDRVSLLSPGDEVVMRPCAIADAAAAWAQRERSLRRAIGHVDLLG